MMFGAWVALVAWYQAGRLASRPVQAPVAVLGWSPPPLVGSTAQVLTPEVRCQIACSCTVVPGVPPRETKVALPAAPAVAIFWNACTMSSLEGPVITPAGSDGGPRS